MISKTVPVVNTISQERVFPVPRLEQETIKNLSITDSAVSAIPGPEAIWFFHANTYAEAFSSEALKTSLEQTLAAYPFFAGRLEYIPFRKDGDWTERHGRVRAVYGGSEDPGIQLVFAECDHDLATVVPDKSQRGRIWDSSVVPFELFQGIEIQMALNDGVELSKDLSLARVKVTKFADGGIAIATKIVHPISDAQTLVGFVHDWAKNHKRSSKVTANGGAVKEFTQEPILNPDLFMEYTAGDKNASSPDPAIIESSRSLPIHRYDWWASEEGCPPPLRWRTQVAPEVKESGISLPPLSTPIPWHDLDVTAPLSHYNILFNAREIENLYKAAVHEHGPRISRLDALLAHLWTLIIRARNLPGDDEIFLNMIVNFRAKVSPPLPQTFIGTPAILAYAKSTAKDAAGREGLPTLAGALRKTVDALNPTTIPHFLHDAAHQIEPKRYWQVFIGQHHVTATSWLHHGINDVEFAFGQKPRYVEPVMPAYLICVTEGEGDGSSTGVGVTAPSNGNGSGHKRWYEHGATVSIHYETKVMDRLLQDPELRRFDF